MRTIVTFRITSEELNPEEITILTKLQSDRSFRKGELRKKFVTKFGLWSLDSKLDKEDEELDSHINSLLDILEPYTNYFKDLSKVAEIDFFCTIIESAGFVLTANTIARISTVGARLDIHLMN
jgi:hypothetical protein